MKDQPQTDTESVSQEVEALARELYMIGISAMKGPKFNAPACWIDMDPLQKQGWLAIADYILNQWLWDKEYLP